MNGAPVTQTHSQLQSHGQRFLLLALGALGVVYGDIGTSPLYAMRECFSGPHAVPPTPSNVLGVLSVIFWALIVVISIKYLGFVMRANNRGEGGILALMALIRPMRGRSRRGHELLLGLGLFGAALFYGDGMITPAISVLSAVEGLKMVTPLLEPYVVPCTVLLLVGLFWFQHRGTTRVGVIFGPVIAVWFLVLGVLGFTHIIQAPGVVAAINPLYAAHFFVENGWQGFLVLGAAFLVVTGGEALYADMGHFGLQPIRRTWFWCVLPALLLNYFGQGAVLLRDPAAAENLFYRTAPAWGVLPLVVLATLATIIASQAVISGAFSLTRQAVQLGYIPRLRIEHTSAREIGQIYLPGVNWLLMCTCIGLVIGFRSSSNLAAAYGIAVTTTMVITSLLLYVVARQLWGWRQYTAGLLIGCFLGIDLAFFGANILKIPHGGWFPLVVAAVVFTLMATWKQGRQLLARRLRESAQPIERFLRELSEQRPLHVPGTAVFMYGHLTGTPPALILNLKHNKVRHERVVLLTVITAEIPYVATSERLELATLSDGFFRLILHYGFMEDPHVPKALEQIKTHGLDLQLEEVTYFLGRETLFATDKPGMALWREKLFIVMSRNARSATDFFSLPPEQVMELATQVAL
jgi:KUP system potassium uptake protein